MRSLFFQRQAKIKTDHFSLLLGNLIDGQTVFQLSQTPADPTMIVFYVTGPAYVLADGFFRYDEDTNQVIWRNIGYAITDTDHPRIEYPI